MGSARGSRRRALRPGAHAIGRKLYERHWRLGNALGNDAEKTSVNRALCGLYRKGYLTKLPGPYGWYQISPEYREELAELAEADE